MKFSISKDEANDLAVLLQGDSRFNDLHGKLTEWLSAILDERQFFFIKDGKPWCRFGCFPTSTELLDVRQQAAQTVLAYYNREKPTELPAAIANLRDMFYQIHRHTRDDWHTVREMLGMPSDRLLSDIAPKLNEWADALRDGNVPLSHTKANQLSQLGLVRRLRHFLSIEKIELPPGAGYIYLACNWKSTNREKAHWKQNPDERPLRHYKVGMTKGSILERMKKLNAATGVSEPYGPSTSFAVKDVVKAEKLVHEALNAQRPRKNREFFEFPAGKAPDVVHGILKEARLLI